MYVYPVTRGIAMPDGWATRAHSGMDGEHAPDYIAANREKWLQQWRDAVRR